MNSETKIVGERRAATLKHVAEKAGVSRATVSLVLRQSPLVAADTRERVKATISSVGYVYNRGAARLRTGMSGTVGLIVPEITNPFYAELTAGIDETLDAEGRLAFLANSNENPERQARFIRRIKEQGVDGIILCAAAGTAPALMTQLEHWHIPCVQILRSIEGAESDFVGSDFRAGIAAAVEHLAKAGHTDIALLPSSKDTSASRERVDSFGVSMRQHGLDPGRIQPCSSLRSEAAAVVGQLFESPCPPTAIICHNDLIALGAMRELTRRGLKPGRALSVIGFDDIPEASHAVPTLSTVATMPAEVGRQAAKVLLRRIASPFSAYERVLIAPKLMIRET